jgi:hypothetical protein
LLPGNLLGGASDDFQFTVNVVGKKKEPAARIAYASGHSSRDSSHSQALEFENPIATFGSSGAFTGHRGSSERPAAQGI